MNDELSDRLTELEIRFSHQTRMLDELNEVVVDCNQRIDRLQKENLRLSKMVENLTSEFEESPDE